MSRRVLALAMVFALAGCGAKDEHVASMARDEAGPASAAPAAADADAFIAAAEQQLADSSLYSAKVAWVNATYLNEDTDWLNARALAERTALSVRLANEAARFDAVAGLSFDTRRKLDILERMIVLPAPSTPGAAEELATLSTRLKSAYGKGRARWAASRNPATTSRRRWAPTASRAAEGNVARWHDNVGAPMREIMRGWSRSPTRARRSSAYADTRRDVALELRHDARGVRGADRQAVGARSSRSTSSCTATPAPSSTRNTATRCSRRRGPIRADLLGNMWAQEWGNIYDIVAPQGAGDVGYDLTELLGAKGYDADQDGEDRRRLLHLAGLRAAAGDLLAALADSRSPRDREVVCHASAWDIDNKDDLRIKMCTKVNATISSPSTTSSATTIYQRAYNQQPYLYLERRQRRLPRGDRRHRSRCRSRPNIWSRSACSIAAKVPSADKDIGLLLRQAMDKVAFLPFGLLVDKWRWGVFDGQIPPSDYNTGLERAAPAVPGHRAAGRAQRSDDFDPGAKYHIPGNMPYTRYFLARILQFQFYKAACEQAGWKGPLHRC